MGITPLRISPAIKTAGFPGAFLGRVSSEHGRRQGFTPEKYRINQCSSHSAPADGTRSLPAHGEASIFAGIAAGRAVPTGRAFSLCAHRVYDPLDPLI
jgi:hypothetical protein